jgi:hypothetical protein
MENLIKKALLGQIFNAKSHEEVLDILEDIGAINPFWAASSEIEKEGELPKSFTMISPLFKGLVTLIEKRGHLFYIDGSAQVRLEAINERAMLKKIKKYKI